MRKCTRCVEEKLETDFFKKINGRLESWCKSCKRQAAYEREKRDPNYKNKERERNLLRNSSEERKEWRKKHQLQNRERINKESNERRDRNREKYLETERKRREKNRIKFNEQIQKSRLKYPEKVKARGFLNHAIKYGYVIKPNLCSKCNIEDKLHAHHEDYEKPLDVIWLCRICHGKAHRR